MQRWMWAGIAAGAVLLSASGCSLFRIKPAGGVQPTSAGGFPNDFIVSALPVYRLVVNQALLDLPSRLLVFQLRLSGSQVGVLSVTGDNVQLVLPNGEPGRVFDRGRATELLHRATLADADLAYVRRGAPPGGFDEVRRQQMAESIATNLLSDGVFTSDQPMQGYVVVDTLTPLASLDGVVFQVTAYRLSDGAAAHGAYRYGPAAPAEAAPAAPTAVPAAPSAEATITPTPSPIAPPTAEAVATPTAEAATPTAEAATPTAEAATPTAEPATPTAEAATPTAEAVAPPAAEAAATPTLEAPAAPTPQAQ